MRKEIIIANYEQAEKIRTLEFQVANLIDRVNSLEEKIFGEKPCKYWTDTEFEDELKSLSETQDYFSNKPEIDVSRIVPVADLATYNPQTTTCGFVPTK